MRKIDWNLWTSIAEIVSSLAILSTLVYLAIQTEQNNELLEIQALGSIRNNKAEFSLLIMSDKELRASMIKQGFVISEVFSAMSQDPDEALRLRYYSDFVFASWNQEYNDSIRTGLDPPVNAYRNAILDQPYLVAAWSDRKRSYPADFRNFMENIVFNQDPR
jgi:hypothetical protein